jgi:ribosomal protein L3 glutamine methyltransferase
MTLSQLIESVATQLARAELAFGQGTANAADEAAWLVLWQLGLPLDFDFYDATHDVALSDTQLSAVQALLAKRITSRQPTAYLTQEAWLQGVSFYVDERVIVPRSLIAEVLADASLDPWLHSETRRVLDLCTGNGSLGILVALTYPDCLVHGLDVSQAALDVAAINVARHGLEHRMRLIASDGLQHAEGLYDLIVCNPPYVNSYRMATLPPEFRAEPALALAGGADGMDFIRMLLRDAPRFMSPHAILVLEVGHERAHFESAFPALEAVWLEVSAGTDQVLLLTREALSST